MDVVVTAALGAAALIHLLPLVGVLGASRVSSMYGVLVEGPDLAVLLVHRAVLFGLLAAALVVAIFDADFRPYAIGAVLVSDVAFLLVARAHTGLNDAMKRVVAADVISVAFLLIAALGELTG